MYIHKMAGLATKLIDHLAVCYVKLSDSIILFL